MEIRCFTCHWLASEILSRVRASCLVSLDEVRGADLRVTLARQIAEVLADLRRRAILKRYEFLHGRGASMKGKADRSDVVERVLELVGRHTRSLELLPEHGRFRWRGVAPKFHHGGELNGGCKLPDLEAMSLRVRLFVVVRLGGFAPINAHFASASDPPDVLRNAMPAGGAVVG